MCLQKEFRPSSGNCMNIIFPSLSFLLIYNHILKRLQVYGMFVREILLLLFKRNMRTRCGDTRSFNPIPWEEVEGKSLSLRPTLSTKRNSVSTTLPPPKKWMWDWGWGNMRKELRAKVCRFL